jgi:hypothetical protein
VSTRRVFPRDAIEATAVRLKYGLNNATYLPLAAGLHAWRVGSAVFHSEGDVRRAIGEAAHHEPPQTRVPPAARTAA